MGDGYFYTLSAIAQSFAAIMGLNAIFVVYKLQIISNQYRDLLQQARQWWVRDQAGPIGTGSTHDHYKTESDRLKDEFFIYWLKQSSGQVDIVEKKEEFNKELISNNKHKKDIVIWFKWILISNSFIIGLSLLFLPWKNYICEGLHICIISIMLLLSFGILLITVKAVFITSGLEELNLFSHENRNGR